MRSQPALDVSVRSPGAIAVARRWSMFTQSGVVRGQLAPIERGECPRMTDQVCAWAAASPARYRASSSAMAASNVVEVEHDDRRDPLVGVDLDDAEHLDEERVGPWSLPEKR